MFVGDRTTASTSLAGTAAVYLAEGYRMKNSTAPWAHVARKGLSVFALLYSGLADRKLTALMTLYVPC